MKKQNEKFIFLKEDSEKILIKNGAFNNFNFFKRVKYPKNKDENLNQDLKLELEKNKNENTENK